MNVDLDRLGDDAAASAPTAERTVAELRDRSRRRQRQRRIMTSLVAVPVVLLLIFAAWSLLDRRSSDGQELSTDGYVAASARIGDDLGDFVWPAPPRNYATPEELTAAFVDEVTHWPQDEVAISDGLAIEDNDPSSATGVMRVTYGDLELVLVAARSDAGWGFVSIGTAAGTADESQAGDPTVKWVPPDGTVTNVVTARFRDGTILEETVTTPELRVPSDQSLDKLRTVLVVFQDESGKVIDVSGGQFQGAISPQTTSMSEDVPVAPTGPLPEPPMTTPPPTNVPPRPVEVPNVIGEPVGDMVSLLDMLGVRSLVVQAASNTGAPGMVTAADPPPGSQVAAGGTVELTYSPQRSQSEADAARDLIVDELAALPPSLRINSVVEDGEPTELVTAQGTWIISEPNPMWKYSVFGELPDGCVLGDPTGVYGKDFICVDTYREILLLDPTTGAIIRAYPFPEVTPDGLVATDTAVYCNRQGDGGVPESLLCRIGLDDLKADVRIFPPPNTDDAGAVPKAWTPSYWAVDSTPDLADLAIFSRLTTTGSAVTASGAQGSATVDPGTLELSDITRQQNPGFGPPDMPPPNAVFDGVFTYWDVEDVQVNGRWITIPFTGGSEYDAESQCSHGYSIEAEETDDAVTLTITEWRPPTKDLSDLNVACTAVGFGRQVRVELDEPLRNRVIRKGY